jgi:hypothetical protein
MIRLLALGVVFTTGAVAGGRPPLAAQTAASPQLSPVLVVQAQSPTGAPSIVPPPAKDSYRNVFQTTAARPQAQEALAALAEQLPAKAHVVCGLTMIQVDPKTDAKIRRDLPSAPTQEPNISKQPDFKIRRIVPTVCRD